MRGTSWTAKDRKRALELRAEGLTARAAAEKMSQEGAKKYTKGMVIGIWHRNPPEMLDRLTLEPLPHSNIKNEYFVRVKKIRRKEEALAAVDESVAGKVVALKPEDCRYPIGDIRSSGFKFCCAPILMEVTSSYCAEHHELCHPPPGKNGLRYFQVLR